MLIQLKKILPIALISLLVFISCKKDKDVTSAITPPPSTNGVTPDLSTKVSSSVSGFVTNENNLPVMGADVKVGDRTVTTDKYGYFSVKNVQVVKTAAMVTVIQPGYFKGIKTYIAVEGKGAFFRIKLIPKTNSGNINAASGGNVTLANGLVVGLPANAVVNASTNAAYTGSVNVASYWIDPTSTELSQIMPGDLRGLDDAGSIKGLTTYGMTAVELTGASGELLQVAAGQKATLTLPLPSSLTGSAPSSIPLWYFDESNGLWKQNGTATKTGNTYVGEVSHFSFWNCDMPSDYVHFECTLLDATGAPLSSTPVKISVVGSPNTAAWGYTDSTGYVGGLVPDNAQLQLDVYSSWTCGNSAYTQTFSTTTTDISLGNIIVNTSSSLATVSGTVTDCASNPVIDGYVMINQDGWFYRYPVSSTGTFEFTTLICNSPATVLIVAEDNIGLQQSTPATQVLVTGLNVLGNLQACGVNTAEFLTYTVNGAQPAITYTGPIDSLFQYGNGTNSQFYINAFNSTNSETSFTVDNTGIGVGTIQNLLGFSGSQTVIPEQTTITTPIGVNITEYGAVGEYIAGSFNGTIYGAVAPNNPYVISGTFRVRRNF